MKKENEEKSHRLTISGDDWKNTVAGSGETVDPGDLLIAANLAYIASGLYAVAAALEKK